MYRRTSDIKKISLSICLVLLFVSSGSDAEIFKWVGENGKTHYSDKKPEAEKLKVEESKLKTSARENPEDVSTIPK